MLAHLYTLLALMTRTSWVANPTVMPNPWECTSSCHHQLFLRTSHHIINSIKNPSPYKCKPCSSPWSIPHLICNMLSMMSGTNVLHEINDIYPNNIIHLQNIHLLKVKRSSHQPNSRCATSRSMKQPPSYLQCAIPQDCHRNKYTPVLSIHVLPMIIDQSAPMCQSG